MASNPLKGLFLGLTLLFPVLIYLFLQLFGENKYALPVFYPTGVTSWLENPPEKREYEIKLYYSGEGAEIGWEKQCIYESQPHTVSPVTFKTLVGNDFQIETISTAYVVGFLPLEEKGEDYNFLLSELTRIREEYTTEEVQLVLIFADSALNSRQYPVISQLAGWHGVLGSPEEVVDWANCQLVLPHALGYNLSASSPYTPMLTLVDDQQRIRGYFDGSQQAETDRLNLELRVLLQEE